MAGTISFELLLIFAEKRLLLKKPPNQQVHKPISVAANLIVSIRYPKCSRSHLDSSTAPTIKS